MNMLFRIVWRALLGCLCLALVLGTLGVIYLESTLPSVEVLKDIRLQVPLKVFTREGQLIAEFGEERRTPIALDQVPKTFIHAILATEDRRFYEHRGVDLRGLARASFHLLTNASLKQGGSTITMQVARNFFLSRQKTFARKLSEILLAFKIEQELSKDDILALYLNKIYFGKRAYGIAAAANIYYGCTVNHLTLDQMAMLAGLPQAPSSINPLHDPAAAYKRRKHVLERMLAYQFISEKEFAGAVDAPLPTQSQGRSTEVEAPYLAEMVRQALFARFGEALYEGGYEVYTTIDGAQQTMANAALRRALLEYDQRHGYRKTPYHFHLSTHKTAEQELLAWRQQLKAIPTYNGLLPGIVMRVEDQKIAVLLQDGRYIDIPWKGLSWARLQGKNNQRGHAPQKPSDVVVMGDVIYADTDESGTWKMSQVPQVGGALVALAPKNGAILALVGGFDYSLSPFNRVTQAERLPGSNFKPFLYAAALNEGYTLASVINDAPVVYTDPITGVTWRPQNNTKKFYGPTRLRVSLMRSQNIATVRLLRAIGVEKLIAFATRFGFKAEKLPPYLSLALGTAQVTPLDLAATYCVFANGGHRIEPYFITTIKDYQGKLIYEAPKPQPVPAISPSIAFLMTSALQDAIQHGTGQRAKSLGRKDLAGKTGTTNEWLDAWYSGYNPDIMTTAWVGFDEPRSLKEYGATAALPMWMYFMEAALKNKPDRPLIPPPGIVSVKIDPDTGLAAQPGQKNAIYEFFMENARPGRRTQIDPQITTDHEDNAVDTAPGIVPPMESLF
ncbi:MAG: penicillin-binding protein 1A [Gammaproteobacteria bacterium]|nr:penicillin-binding protein 1A [Gammaproteobacteria bacterium]MBP9729382.1 penicillin-binding protein 1A [Gammaproteobacteria bacterium]